MSKRYYAVRIAQYTNGNGNKSICVTFNDDSYLELLDKGTYFTIKRMNDRLAFVGWKNKMTGATLLNNNMLQYALADDIETASEFVGEYNILRDANDTMMFVSLEDRRNFSLQLPSTSGKTRHHSQPDTVHTTEQATPSTPLLVDALSDAITRTQNSLAELSAERDKIAQQLQEIDSRREALEFQLDAYRNALAVAKGE